MEPYILILLAAAMAVSHFLVFRLVFDDDFESRFAEFRTRQRAILMKENQEFVNGMRGVIELDPESVEASGFGEKWRHKLASIDAVLDRRRELEGRIHVVYFILIASVLTSAAGLGAPNGIMLPLGYVLYVTSFSWWLLLWALMLMLWMLLRYQMIDGELSKSGFDEDRRGIRISSGENMVSRLWGRLMSLLGL